MHEVFDVLQHIAADDAVPRTVRERIGKYVEVMNQVGMRAGNDVDAEREPQPSSRMREGAGAAGSPPSFIW